MNNELAHAYINLISDTYMLAMNHCVPGFEAQAIEFWVAGAKEEFNQKHGLVEEDLPPLKRVMGYDGKIGLEMQLVGIGIDESKIDGGITWRD